MLDKPDDRRNLLKVVVVGQDTRQRAEIRSALAELDEPELEVAEAAPQLAVALNGSGGTEVAMVMLEGGEESALEYLQSQAQSSPRPALFALLRERSTSLMRRALRAGADEVLFLPLDHGDATRALLKISEARRRVERPGRGQVCALVSITGGVGVTTLSANLALGLRHLSQKQVAVVDLDLQASDLSVVLNLEPERTIVDISDPGRKLDSIGLESALSKHPSGIYLLAAPKRIEDSETVTSAQVGAALDLMRQLFDFVVVDCGRHINENTVAVWERCDHLFYVLDQSIGAVRCAWRFIDLFGRLDLTGVEPNFLLNRYNTRHVVSEEQITHTLARPVYSRLPRDDAAHPGPVRVAAHALRRRDRAA